METFNWFDQRSLQIGSMEYPKIVYSFSSKSLRDINIYLEKYIPFLKSNYVLLSAYDIVHTYEENLIRKFVESISGEIFIDSGKFESEKVFDLNELHFYDYKPEPWNLNLYIECITSLVGNKKNFYIVNYDGRSKIRNQIQKSINTFEEYNFPGKNVLLIHPEDDYWNISNINILIENLTEKIDRINVLGVTEKELGSNLGDRIKNLVYLRDKLNSIAQKYLPIHIFGCGDPKNIIFLFFAGGDIFDGLSWLRFYFKENSSIYTNEFFYDNYLGLTLNNDLYLHNIQYLTNLATDLNYVLDTKEILEFFDEIKFINKILGD